MTIKSSGSLALTEIQTEFGGANPVGMSEYVRGGTYVPANYPNRGITSSNLNIAVSSYYSTQLRWAFNLTISANTVQFNLSDYMTANYSAYINGAIDFTITINAGVYVYSNSTSIPAFDTGTSWPTGSTITIINNGYIVGCAGSGRPAGSYNQPTGGTGTGGNALNLGWAVSINNSNGYIYGGGGGGGAGGGSRHGIDTMLHQVTGGDGGAGQSATGGPAGGSGGNAVSYTASKGVTFELRAGDGGSGGEFGKVGKNGQYTIGTYTVGATTYSDDVTNHRYITPTGSQINQYWPGSIGGAPGAAIVFNGYDVSWLGGQEAPRIKGNPAGVYARATAGTYSVTIPTGVSMIYFDVMGGYGGSGGNDTYKGYGRSDGGAGYPSIFPSTTDRGYFLRYRYHPIYEGKRVRGWLAVTAGETLTLIVGQGGTSGGSSTDYYNAGGGSGYQTGGQGGLRGPSGGSGSGGGGGGSSAIVRSGTALVVASGGPGGGGGGNNSPGQPKDGRTVYGDATYTAGGGAGMNAPNGNGDEGGAGGGAGGYTAGGHAGDSGGGDNGGSSGNYGNNLIPANGEEVSEAPELQGYSQPYILSYGSGGASTVSAPLNFNSSGVACKDGFVIVAWLTKNNTTTDVSGF